MYGTIADKPDDDEDGTEPRPYTRTGRACRAEDHTGGQLLYCSIAQWAGGCGGVYGLAGLLLLAHSKSVDPRYLTLMGSEFDGPYHHLTGARKRSRTAADGDMHAGCIQQERRWDPASNDRRNEPNAPRCPFLEGQVVTWTTKVGGSIRLLESQWRLATADELLSTRRRTTG